MDARDASIAPVDAVLLDPMFPPRRNTAQVKKQMQILHTLLSDDGENDAALLRQALATAKQRVVVKRPAGAEFLNQQAPHHSLRAPNTRYDVYLIARAPE